MSPVILSWNLPPFFPFLLLLLANFPDPNREKQLLLVDSVTRGGGGDSKGIVVVVVVVGTVEKLGWQGWRGPSRRLKILERSRETDPPPSSLSRFLPGRSWQGERRREGRFQKTQNYFLDKLD